MAKIIDELSGKGSKDRYRSIISKLDQIIAGQQNKSIYIGESLALTKLYTGQKLYVDTRDTSITPHLLLDGYWEKGISDLYLSLIKPGDVIVDAGADFGYYGCISASRLNHQGFVIFAEANPMYKEFLTKNISLNGLGEISYIAMNAVSDKTGQTVSFRLLKDDWASASAMSKSDFESTRKVNYEVDKTIEVKTKTLDEIVKEAGQKSVDLIKMDIEGFEEKAVAGMKKIIKNSPNLKLLIEFTSPAYKNPKKLFEKLKEDLPIVSKVDIAMGSTSEINNYSNIDKKQEILLFSKK